MVVVVVALIFIYPLFNETRSSSIKRNFVSFPLCQIRLDTHRYTTVAINLSKFHRTLSHLPRGETRGLLPLMLRGIVTPRICGYHTTIDLHAADTCVCVCVHTRPFEITTPPLSSSLVCTTIRNCCSTPLL